MSLKLQAGGSELYGPPMPRRPITFNLRQEPGAQGFVTGMHLSGQAWDQLVEADGVGKLALHILALALDSSSVLSGDTRTAIVDDLPDIIQEIAAYWRNPPARHRPANVRRIERAYGIVTRYADPISSG
jgi:hypothetical protein